MKGSSSWTTYVPFVQTFKNYNGRFFKKDFVAALSTVVVTLPQVMACALIIGIDPVYGLYTAVVSIFVCALFGSSEVLITGPTNAIGLLIAGSLKNFLPGDDMFSMLFLLTFIVGILQLLMGVLKLGKVLNYVSHSVMLGFTTGAGLLIGLGQLNQFLGISVPNSNEMGIIEKLYHLALLLNKTNFYALGVGVLTIIIILILKKVNKNLPGSFISIIITGVVVYAFSLGDQGVKLTNDIASALPSFQMHQFRLLFNPTLWSSGIAIAIVGLVEALSIAKAISAKTGQKLDVDQEFRGQGITNIVTSFFKGIVSSGSFSKTAVNYQCGAKTRVAGMFTSIFLAILLLFLAPFARYISLPALAGVMLVISYNLIDKEEIKKQIKVGGVDLAVTIVTFLSTIVFELDMAVYIGVALSVIIFLKDTGKARVKILVPSIRYKGKFKEREIDWVNTHDAEILVLQFEGNLYFGLSQDLKENLEKVEKVAKVFVFRMKHVSNIDMTTLEIIKDFIKKVKADEKEVIFAGLHEPVFSMLEKAEILGLVGQDHYYIASEYKLESSTEALEKARDLLVARQS